TFLRAITSLERAETAVPTAVSAPPAVPQLQGSAERRQVTVLLADLVGSTALSARMDPEDLSEIMSTYQRCVAETVHRFDGFVARYMGDGVLVYFGYPQAHEDDAERAVRAGLDLISARNRPQVTRFSADPCRNRDGLGRRWRPFQFGRGACLAARLQGVAEPNTVVLCDS